MGCERQNGHTKIFERQNAPANGQAVIQQIFLSACLKKCEGMEIVKTTVALDMNFPGLVAGSLQAMDSETGDRAAIADIVLKHPLGGD